MIVIYRIKNNKIFRISREADDYVLQNDEYSSSVWYQKPFFNGSDVVESMMLLLN
jgi:hypothetical protein